MKLKNCFILVFFFSAFSQHAWAQVISAARSTDWSLAGYNGNIPEYNSVRNIMDHGGSPDGVTNNDAALQAAIASLGADSGIIYFPAGTFLFNTCITLRSGLVLKGEGAGSTTLKFNLGGINDLINVRGSTTTVIAQLTAAVSKNQSWILVDAPALFHINDYVKIYQDDADIVNDSWALESVGQILHIENISGDTIFFSNPLRRNYLLADEPGIRKFNMVTGAGIECLKIKRLDQTDPAQYRSNIIFFFAAKCWVKGVESDSANFAHVELWDSKNIEVSNCYFHGAFDYGSAKGYGISCEYTSGDCRIENNIFKHLRHSMLIQSGANGNVFDYNYSIETRKSETPPFDLSGDIVMHGNYPYLNLFEGNIVQNILIDQSHGDNGPFNTLFRNRAELYGIIISSGAGDSANIIGNEITGTGAGKGNYTMHGSGNFEYGNNKNNTIIPTGTTTLTDSSYLYNTVPQFWDIPSAWPPIGIPNVLNSQTIPAKARFNSGSGFAFCPPHSPVTYIFTGNGNWDDASNWNNNLVPPAAISAGSEIIIDPAGDCVLNIAYTINTGVILTVKAGKNFIIQGNLTVQQ